MRPLYLPALINTGGAVALLWLTDETQLVVALMSPSSVVLFAIVQTHFGLISEDYY